MLIRFAGSSAKSEAWGKLTQLSARAARISTLSPMAPGECVELSFELASEAFGDLVGMTAWVERDADGYAWAEVRFTDELARRRLARVLMDLLAFHPG